jgi:hypothetical protein
MSNGACNNPNSYFFDTEIYLPDQPKEECGMRKCIHCPYYLREDELD